MHIVDRKTFLALPNGIVYSYYESLGTIEGLYQKTRTMTNDWEYQSMLDSVDAQDSGEFFAIMFAAEKGKPFIMDLNCTDRDGFFKEDQMFVIYNIEDLSKLVAVLNGIVATYPDPEGELP